jgi:hypothetical protein
MAAIARSFAILVMAVSLRLAASRSRREACSRPENAASFVQNQAQRGSTQQNERAAKKGARIPAEPMRPYWDELLRVWRRLFVKCSERPYHFNQALDRIMDTRSRFQ